MRLSRPVEGFRLAHQHPPGPVVAGPVVAGYDIGIRVAQQLAADRPDLVGALVLCPPLPGAGRRVVDPAGSTSSSAGSTWPVPRAGHLVPLEAPDAFAAAVDPAVAR